MFHLLISLKIIGRENINMKIEDLKSCMVFKTRCNTFYMVLKDADGIGDFYLNLNTKCTSMAPCCYDNDTMLSRTINNFDIMKVYGLNDISDIAHIISAVDIETELHNRSVVLWTREKLMTKEQIEEALGYKITIVE